jgi:hypothetical protein
MLELTHRRFFPCCSALIGVAFALGVVKANANDSTMVSPTTSTSPSSTTAASQPTEELISKFTTFAGSTTNAQSLVNGLRSGSSVTLQPTTTTTPPTPAATFTPPTNPMGFGNINIALSLAKSELASQGITQPTPLQIETALLGGSLTTASGSTSLPGVLTLRSSGQGWGEIAHTLGVKVGDVMRNDKAQHFDKDANFTQDSKPQRPEKVERVARADRPERPQRPDRPERVDRPDRPKH